MADVSREEKEVLKSLKAGRWNDAEQLAFQMEGNPALSILQDSILKTTRFWQKRHDFFIYNGEHSGKKIFIEWEKYIDFCRDYSVKSSDIFLATKSYIFKRIIDFLSRASRECDNTNREILVLLAYAFYEVDIIDQAKETLEYILGRFPNQDDVRVFTLLGDLYTQSSKIHDQDIGIIMFNELFLKCVEQVDFDSIDYEVIAKLAHAVRSDLLPENEIKYWVPIYGYLYGGLTIRRNLRYEEYKKLQEKISVLEDEIRGGDRIEILIPQVMNAYFWIFDYYTYQMKTLDGAQQIYRRILELLAMLCQISGYEDIAKKLGLHAEKVFDILIQTAEQSNNQY